MIYWVIGRRKPAARVDRDPEYGANLAAERLGPFESLEQARQARTQAAAGAEARDSKVASFEIVLDYA